jgi:hypothetical protein
MALCAIFGTPCTLSTDPKLLHHVLIDLKVDIQEFEEPSIPSTDLILLHQRVNCIMHLQGDLMIL